MVTSSLSTLKVVWFRRPWVLITFAIVVVIGVSVVTDLPHPITKAQDAAAQNATIKQINTDIGPCGFAVKESFSFYQRMLDGTLTAENRRQIPALLVGDQSACTLASGGGYDMTVNIQPLETKAGKHIDQLMAMLVRWMTNDAKDAILDIQYLFTHPGDGKTIHDLSLRQLYLSEDRTAAINDVTDASAVLGITLTEPKLPVLPHLSGT